MSDKLNALVATAEGWIKTWELVENWAEAEHERKMVAALTAARTEAERLRTALREVYDSVNQNGTIQKGPILRIVGDALLPR